MLLADDAGATNWIPYAQLGAFGLLLMGWGWFLWYGVPMFMKRQRHVLARLVKAFKEQAKAHSDEREQWAAQAAAERTLDREMWRMLNATLAELVAELKK